MFNNLSLDDMAELYMSITNAIVELKNGVWVIDTPEETLEYTPEEMREFLEYELNAEMEGGFITVTDFVNAFSGSLLDVRLLDSITGEQVMFKNNEDFEQSFSASVTGVEQIGDRTNLYIAF